MANKNRVQKTLKEHVYEDGTYSRECCKGEEINQGIGSLACQDTSVIINTSESRVIIREN